MATFVFSQAGDFEACRAAEDWCATHGLSVGHAERGNPRGLLFGDFDIQKWRNLRKHERDALHGTMTGDMRNGPVVVDVDAGAVRAAGGLIPSVEAARALGGAQALFDKETAEHEAFRAAHPAPGAQKAKGPGAHTEASEAGQEPPTHAGSVAPGEGLL